MTRKINNAFTRPAVRSAAANQNGSENQSPARGEAIAPLRAFLHETDFGWSLWLSPMTAVDALSVFSTIGVAGATSNLLMAAGQSSWTKATRATGDQPMTMGAIAERLGIKPIDQFGHDDLVLDNASLVELLSAVEIPSLRLVRIEGPLETADAIWIEKAIAAGQSPLLAEVRAVAALDVRDDGSVTLHVRRQRDALALLAEQFGQYLSAVLNQPSEKLGRPELWQLERVMSLTGKAEVRPVETQVFSTSVDVGISTRSGEDAGPADRSFIYDRPSETWHDEP